VNNAKRTVYEKLLIRQNYCLQLVSYIVCMVKGRCDDKSSSIQIIFKKQWFVIVAKKD